MTEFHPWPIGEAGTHPSHLPTSLHTKDHQCPFPQQRLPSSTVPMWTLGRSDCGSLARALCGAVAGAPDLTLHSAKRRAFQRRQLSLPASSPVTLPECGSDFPHHKGLSQGDPLKSISHPFQILQPPQPPWFFLIIFFFDF